jgi:hypothetical protein
MFKPGKLRNLGCFSTTPFKDTQGKFEARVIAANITFHEAGYNLRSYIRIHDSKRSRLAYGNQGFSIA